jgi:hypothetical protein
LSSGTRHINLIPFQVHHLGPYFGIIRTTKLYDMSFLVPLFPDHLVDFIIEVSEVVFTEGLGFESP